MSFATWAHKSFRNTRSINTERRTVENFRRRGSLRLSPGEFQVLILYKHTYNSESWVSVENGRLLEESSRFSPTARRQQLKHRNCHSTSFEHPLPPSHYRYSPSEKFFERTTYKLAPILALWRIAIQMVLNERSSEVLKESRKLRRPIDKEEKTFFCMF